MLDQAGNIAPAIAPAILELRVARFPRPSCATQRNSSGAGLLPVDAGMLVALVRGGLGQTEVDAGRWSRQSIQRRYGLCRRGYSCRGAASSVSPAGVQRYAPLRRRDNWHSADGRWITASMRFQAARPSAWLTLPAGSTSFAPRLSSATMTRRRVTTD